MALFRVPEPIFCVVVNCIIAFVMSIIEQVIKDFDLVEVDESAGHLAVHVEHERKNRGPAQTRQRSHNHQNSIERIREPYLKKKKKYT
jgi:hypothetical protein